jgi:AcrR family transcriptional regulator
MESQDHRPRVAAERRERMRARLLGSALQLVAEKGPAATSIDDVIAAAEVSRGTFYKYFPSPDAMVRELAFEVAKDLVYLADPIVRERDDPAERVACGIRLVARLALHHPAAAGFLVQLGWPDTQGDNVLLEFVRRDLAEGMKQGRFRQIPMPLALNIVSGGVIGAIHCMLKDACEPDFPELTAAAVLRALGMAGKTADALSSKRLETQPYLPEGLLAATLPVAREVQAEATRSRPRRPRTSG